LVSRLEKRTQGKKKRNLGRDLKVPGRGMTSSWEYGKRGKDGKKMEDQFQEKEFNSTQGVEKGEPTKPGRKGKSGKRKTDQQQKGRNWGRGVPTLKDKRSKGGVQRGNNLKRRGDISPSQG